MNRRHFLQRIAVAGGAALGSISAALYAQQLELAALDEFVD